MLRNARLLRLVPAVCAIFIVLSLTVLRPHHTSDFTRGVVVGVFLGISILSLLALKRKTAHPARP
jgi:hypothetical protein